MRADEFRAVIDEIQGVLKAAGNQAVSDRLGDLARELEVVGDGDIDSMVERLRRVVDQMGAPVSARYTARLLDAGLDEGEFARVMDDIGRDASLKKQELQSILKSYTGRFDKKAGVEQLKSDLKRAFYAKVYEHDAQNMANRATPL